MTQGTLVRGRLADHLLWAKALATPELVARTLLPAIVSAGAEDRDRVEGVPWLERLSITELVREARSAAQAGIAGLLLFGATDRKDELALLAREPDAVVPRAVRAVKEAVPDLIVATDVCVCTHTAHGQCVLFGKEGPDVRGTLERLAEIAVVHASAGADLLIPSGMLDGTVGAIRAALADIGHARLPVAAMAKLESAYYATHRAAVQAVPIAERAVPLLAADDPAAARARVLRDAAAGGDVVVLKPGAPTLDLVGPLGSAADRPVIAFFTADEHALFVAAGEGMLDAVAAEREQLAAARRAGADAIISYGAWSLTDRA